MRDKIMWILMGGIMALGIAVAISYFSSLKEIASFGTITRELALVDNADNRLNILFDAKNARRDFSIANADMRGIYQVIEDLENSEIIARSGLLNDVKGVKSAFGEKIALLDELGALNSQNLVLLQSLEQKFLAGGKGPKLIKIYSQILGLNYKNRSEISALQNALDGAEASDLNEVAFVGIAREIVKNFERQNRIVTDGLSQLNMRFANLRQRFSYASDEFYGSFAQMTMIYTAVFLSFLLLTYIINSDALRFKRTLAPYRALCDEASEGALLADENFKIFYANKQALSLFGYEQEELKGADVGILAPEDKRGEILNLANKDAKDTRLICKNGESVDVSLKIVNIAAPQKSPVYALFAKDVTQLEIMRLALAGAKESLTNQVYIDHLTGKGNEAALYELINAEKTGIVIYLTIVNFANLRLFYKAETTNEILRSFARTLAMCIESNEIKAKIFRIQSDEFCLFYEGSNITRDVEIINKYFTDKVFNLHTTEGFASAPLNVTIGVSERADVAGGANRVFQAVMAMYEAQGKNEHVGFYSRPNVIEEKYLQNQIMINTIQNAIKKNQVFVLVQPIFDITHRDMSGNTYGTNDSDYVPLVYEILIRLIDRSGKTRCPGEFIDIAKQTSLYIPLTRVVIDEAFRLLDRFAGTKFSINLSYFDIANEGIKELLCKKLASSPNASNLFIEILESEEFDDYESLRSFIAVAKNYGCTIAIDDFGSGYSNYYRILTLDVDYIKIDGALIKNIANDKNSRAIVETIAGFAKKQGYELIAEYVENHEISMILEEMGIRYMQGYFYSKPMEPSKIKF